MALILAIDGVVMNSFHVCKISIISRVYKIQRLLIRPQHSVFLIRINHLKCNVNLMFTIYNYFTSVQNIGIGRLKVVKNFLCTIFQRRSIESKITVTQGRMKINFRAEKIIPHCHIYLSR